MPQGLTHRVLLGGIGGDSHSVGLLVLRRALADNGYDVRYLGTQNTLPELFEHADGVDLVMVSCMDGHALHYLRRFPELVRRHGSTCPWFLGGNPVVDASAVVHRRLVELGFRRVFLQFVEIESVLDALRQELAAVPRRPPAPGSGAATRSGLAGVDVVDVALPMPDFERERAEVLQQWPTGPGASDRRDNAAFLSRRPSLAARQAEVLAGGRRTLVQPRSGVALPGEQARMFEAYRAAGCAVVSYQVDSLTRNNAYADAAELLRESRTVGMSMLNGFPVVNHGVPVLRQIGSGLDAALQVRHSTRDPRLLAEISYAGGATGFEGGAISYNIPYYKNYPLGEAIRRWQYVDRLTGIYADDFGLNLDREYFGVLTATLIPPSLAIATGILEALLGLRQGVRCVSIGYAEQGNRTQDVAAIRSIVPLATEVFTALGHERIQVNAVYHQYMAAFPPYSEQCRQLIMESSVTAGAGGATRMLTKTAQEPVAIPSVADNLEGIALSLRGLSMAGSWEADDVAIEEEQRWIRREVLALVEATIEAGGGDVARGIVTAFERGLLDVPFSPSIHNAQSVATARDRQGAVRYLATGALPFDADVRRFHADRMGDRRRADGIRPEHDYLLIERDVLQVARGQYERWPLGS